MYINSRWTGSSLNAARIPVHHWIISSCYHWLWLLHNNHISALQKTVLYALLHNDYTYWLLRWSCLGLGVVCWRILPVLEMCIVLTWRTVLSLIIVTLLLLLRWIIRRRTITCGERKSIVTLLQVTCIITMTMLWWCVNRLTLWLIMRSLLMG